MSINTSPIAEKTRDQITLVSDYSLFLGHEGTGTALTDSAPAAKQLIGDISPSTMVSVWGVENNYEPDGNQTYRNTDAGLAAKMAGTAGTQLIMSVDILAASPPATNSEVFFAYGNTAASGNGGFRFGMIHSGTAGRAQLVHYGADGTTATKNGIATVCDGARHNVMAVIDNINLTGSLYIDGAIIGAAVSLGTAADLTKADATYGTTVVCGNTGGPSFTANVGGQGSDAKLNRMLIMRTSTDISAQIPTLAQQMTEITHELPWGFDGL